MSTTFSDRLGSKLARAQSLVAFTGAGISAESGVPTFRGADGIWRKMRPEEMASMEGFMKNPSLVWEWYAHRRTIIHGVQPNAGHRALVALEGFFPVFALITQNIDNLHRRAGSVVVHELHGNIERNYCMDCGAQYRDTDVPLRDGRPTCLRCGGLVRPDVVWFGEMLPDDAWSAAVRAAESADCFLTIGTSALVYPAASLPLIARRQGAYLVEVNPEATPLTDHTDEFLQGPAGSILPELVDLVRKIRANEEAGSGRG